jgi:hypothetical protein
MPAPQKEDDPYSRPFKPQPPSTPQPPPAAPNQQTWGCTEFAKDPEGAGVFDPVALTLDPSRDLVYVGDYTYSVIFAFSHDGTFHGRVGTTKGFLINPPSLPPAPRPSSP